MTDTTAPQTRKSAKPAQGAKARGLVQVAPDSELPETRSKSSGGRGLVIGLGLGAAFWAAVAAVAIAVRN